MSYQGYVVAAYCVFAVVLLWDFVAPRLQLRQQLRAARLRAARVQAPAIERNAPLSRNPPSRT
jgi:heme exporter protein D